MDARLLVTAMAELSRTATGDFAMEHMLTSLCEVAAEAVDVDGAGVMIRREGRNLFVHASTPIVQPVELLQQALLQGPCADCLVLERPVVVPDLTDAWPDYRALSAELELGAVVAVPLISRGRGWGALDLYRQRPGPWTAEELRAIQTLADVAVSYLVMGHDRDDARRAHRALARRATHDDLTGLPNRALLFDRLEHALGSASRRDAGVAVVFLDLDLFKGINDTFGHTAADAVLVEVARRLGGTLRRGDTLARFAGDEFVIVCEGLPGGPSAVLAGRVQALAGRLQRALQPPIRIGPVQVVVSASIGAAITTDRVTGQELLAEADTAMYAAKQSGRGQVNLRDRTRPSAIGYAHQLERELCPPRVHRHRDQNRAHRPDRPVGGGADLPADARLAPGPVRAGPWHRLREPQRPRARGRGSR